MPLRKEHGKIYLATPRLKDAPRQYTVRDPLVGRNAKGEFDHGNQAAVGKGWKALIKRTIGELIGDEEADAITLEAMKVFSAELKHCPADTPAVRMELAAMARRSVVAGVFHAEAIRVGITSPEGRLLEDASLKHEDAASRHRNNAHIRALADAKSQKTRPLTQAQIAKMFEPAK